MSTGQRVTGNYLLKAVSITGNEPNSSAVHAWINDANHDPNDPVQNDITAINLEATETTLYGNATVNANMHIAGDLVVDGISTTVNSVELTITDSMITLAKDTIDSSPSPAVALQSLQSGIEVDRGTIPLGVDNPHGIFTPRLYWDESLQSWMLSDGTTTTYIVSNTGGTIGLTAVQDDPFPVLGGQLDLNGNSLVSNDNEIRMQSPLTLPQTFPTQLPTDVNSVTVFNNGAYGFGSGLSYVNAEGNTGELVSKAQALIFAMIF